MKKLSLCFLVLLSTFTSFAIGPITGASSVCQGHTTVLADISAGGTWSSGSVAVATVGSTGIVTGVSAGSAIISYRIGAAFSTLTIAVNSNPSAITGNSETCVFSEIYLMDTTAGGTWTSSDAAVANVFTGGVYGYVEGISAGTSIISYTLSTGCYALATVTVAATPGPITGPTSICAGDTVRFTDTPGGGTWSSSDITVANIGSTTGLLTGVTAGFVEISYTLSAACPATTYEELYDSSSVYIYSFDGSAVCVGGYLFMDGEPFGGKWSASGATATIDSSTGYLSGIAAGTDVITYSLGGKCRTTTTVDIITSLPPITGTPVACASGFGGSYLSDSIMGGTWSSSNLSIVEAYDGDLEGFSPGTAVITYSLGGSCMATIVATVLPSPVINAPPAICVGTSTMLTDSLAGGYWSSFTSYAATLSSTGLITGVAPGYAYITYTVDSFCSSSAEIQVIPGVSPIFGTSEFCTHVQSLLADSLAGGIWTSTNPGIAIIDSTIFGAQAAVISGVSAGTDTIIYSVAPGCEAVFPITIYRCNDAVNNVPTANTEIKLYPDPVTETLNIDADPAVYHSLSIYNETGQLLVSKAIGTAVTSLDVRSLPNGIYLISLQGIKGNSVTKFVKSE